MKAEDLVQDPSASPKPSRSLAEPISAKPRLTRAAQKAEEEAEEENNIADIIVCKLSLSYNIADILFCKLSLSYNIADIILCKLSLSYYISLIVTVLVSYVFPVIS